MGLFKIFPGQWFGNAVLLLCLVVGFGTPAAAELMVTPKRIILDEGSQSGTLRILNQKSTARSYEITWTQLRMDELGRLIQDPNPNAPGNSSSLVSVTPRRVTLAPGEAQTVRVRARIPNGLPVGEYISHLSFQPSADDGSRRSGARQSGAQLQLNVRIGIAVPIIVRHGELSATASLQPIALNLRDKHLALRIDRRGTASIYGNLEAYWGRPGQKGTLIAQLNGFAVYPNVNHVERQIPLIIPKGTEIKGGLLHVLLREPSKNTALAETTVRLK